MNEIKKIIENMSILQKYIVLLLKSNDSVPVRGNTWFQKELFLMAKNIPRLEEEADYDSDMFGPYSETAEDELQELEMDEIVCKSGNMVFLSKIGNGVGNELQSRTSKDELEMIAEFKELLNDLNDKELLTLVYFSFPDMIDESLVKDGIIRNRKVVAMQLYKKGKISLQRAAEIAGEPLEIIMMGKCK